jgi:hypothetical protein
MRRLFSEWTAEFAKKSDRHFVEPPLEGEPSDEEVERRMSNMSELDFDDPAVFLRLVHGQAFYFQARFFPRLRWFTLRSPSDEFFIIGDRAVPWGVPPYHFDAPPACLRDPAAFVLAPLSRSLVLVGRNDPAPWEITPAKVNALLAIWSHSWIAGPTESVVTEALEARRWWLDVCELDRLLRP